MTRLRKAIEAQLLDKQLADGSTLRRTGISCAGMAELIEPELGYPPALTAVSRVMGEIGWEKGRGLDGKIYFRRPSEEGGQ